MVLRVSEQAIEWKFHLFKNDICGRVLKAKKEVLLSNHFTENA